MAEKRNLTVGLISKNKCSAPPLCPGGAIFRSDGNLGSIKSRKRKSFKGFVVGVSMILQYTDRQSFTQRMRCGNIRTGMKTIKVAAKTNIVHQFIQLAANG